MAQLTGSVAWVPMEVIKEKMMIQGQVQTTKSYTGSFHMIKDVLAREGIRGCYRGYSASASPTSPPIARRRCSDGSDG